MTGNISCFSSHVELYQAPAYRLVQNLLATIKGPDLWTEEGKEVTGIFPTLMSASL